MQKQVYNFEEISLDAEIAHREKEIQNIETGLVEIHGMMVDIAKLVNEQGEMVDTIESQIENSAKSTKSGISELQIADRDMSSFSILPGGWSWHGILLTIKSWFD